MESPDIFDYSLREQIKEGAPLADRMRPRTLEQFVGQDHILAEGRLLRRAIQADQISSLIFFGPPGTGKTTLARIIANTTKSQFISLNAVLSGVKEIRASIAEAESFRKQYARKTILFIDEVHRFNKAQQDALLPHVENGTVILIGATTENPYFEVNKALVSRSRVFQLVSLESEDLERVLEMALTDPERGYGQMTVKLSKEAKAHLVQVANGDARAVLNALELAIETSKPDQAGLIQIDLAIAEESIQRKAVLYDKDGDAHFDTISAFIKSMRGSDVDAALYWMAKMVYGGEDPRFLFRRMLIFAAEDVGMADPQALSVVTSAARAFDYVGMPEGRFHLAEACIYLSTAPKSNSGFAFFDALDTVANEKIEDVPNHLKDGNRDKEGFGHGKGYLYPHAYTDHWVAQQYLPNQLQGRVFYQPTDQGFEAAIKNEVLRRRETQLAAVFGSDEELDTSRQEYWQGRTLSSTAELLGDIREFTFSQIKFQPHQMILVLNAKEGTFLGETVRQMGESTVYGMVASEREKNELSDRFRSLDYLYRPLLVTGDLERGSRVSKEKSELVNLKFDIILGRSVLAKQESNQARLKNIAALLPELGCLYLTESIPAEAQRLSSFIPKNRFPGELLERIALAENKIYALGTEDQVVWNEAVLREELQAVGFSLDKVKKAEFFNKTTISNGKLTDWFTPQEGERKSYGDYLVDELTAEEIELLKNLLWNELGGKVVRWKSSWVFVKASLKP